MTSIGFVVGLILVGVICISFWTWFWTYRRNLEHREKFRSRFFALANELIDEDSLTVSDISTIQDFASCFSTPRFTRYLIMALADRSRLMREPKSSVSHLPKEVREKWREMFIYGLLMTTTSGPITGHILRYQIAFALSPDEEPTTVRAAQAAISEARRNQRDDDGLPQAA